LPTLKLVLLVELLWKLMMLLLPDLLLADLLLAGLLLADLLLANPLPADLLLLTELCWWGCFCCC
jgi:hypothetical protein